MAILDSFRTKLVSPNHCTDVVIALKDDLVFILIRSLRLTIEASALRYCAANDIVLIWIHSLRLTIEASTPRYRADVAMDHGIRAVSAFWCRHRQSEGTYQNQHNIIFSAITTSIQRFVDTDLVQKRSIARIVMRPTLTPGQ